MAQSPTRLAEQVMVSLEQDMEPTPPPTQRRSLYGVLAHLGPVFDQSR